MWPPGHPWATAHELADSQQAGSPAREAQSFGQFERFDGGFLCRDLCG